MTPLPTNEFKRRLHEPGTQYGLWATLADPVATEIGAGAGFDWMLIDTEHSPNDVRSVLAQLQAVEAYPTSPMVRVAKDDAVLVKQYLDLGVQSIMVPMIESADEAEAMVQAMHYPPQGVRGVGAARASRWGRIDDYYRSAGQEMCLVVQVESVEGVRNIMDIAHVEGVDGVFIGPSDLAASMGHLGDPTHPEVREAVAASLTAVRAAGTAAGALSTNPTIVAEYRDAGANFLAVGVDAGLLATHTRKLAEAFRAE